jgi:two-component system sensor histidine kinase BaeS
MINFFRRHLGAKLFVSYLAVILVGAIVLGLTTRFTVPEAFNRHMGLGLGQGVGQGMMGQGNGTGNGMMSDLFTSFQASFNEALLLALLAAGVVAILVSLLLSRGVIAPLRVLTSASRRIADGHYNERVHPASSDELGQLADSFNQMAEKLEQVESMRRQLIGDVSHELRTPLTAIRGSMEGLMDGVLPATPETYQQIHQEADRLARLVDDLQELSRVEAGSYPLDIRPMAVSTVIQTTLTRFATQAQAKRIDLRSDSPADIPPVLADQDRIIQVLTNLVGNALQYTPAGGQVTIRVTRRQEEVYISVSDTGIGIPSEHIPHLFTRFYRVDKSRSRQAGGGSGIGLTIARHLVEAHGGRIWAESGGEGQGSTFTFTLKVSEEKFLGDRLSV